MKIETKVEYWENKLLDLGKRNRMINCPLPKTGKRVSRSSIMIEIPEIQELWDTVLNVEKGIEFPVDLNTYVEGNEDDEERLAKNTTFINGYKTDQSVTDTCKTLLAMKRKAREFMDNKGMNALYLAFGFLDWKDNGQTGQQLRSPLVLVPVSITQESIADSFFISKNDEEPIGNTPLQQKLLSEFNINIPVFDENDDLQTYFDKVEHECRPLGWTVDRNSVQLTMLSYLKMAMYHDIAIHNDIIRSHPIIRTLNGETNQLDHNEFVDVGSIDHDAEEPRTVYSVVDADSSQQDAITLAKSGASFVLQGPPGTGKSQTITNIIAELLGQGKKVLFVSEKMAALDVVYRRLVSSGLGDFCLTLHNPDAKRKEIMEQLAVSVKLSESKVKFKNEAFEKLESLKIVRESLNKYVAQLHTEVEPLGETIFKVNGYISKFDDYPDIDFVQKNAGEMSSSDLAVNRAALSEYIRIVAKSGYQHDNPWLGSNVKDVNHLFRQKFFAYSEKLLPYLINGAEMLNDVSIFISNGYDDLNYKAGKEFENILQLALKSPNVPYSWLSIDVNATKKRLYQIEADIRQRNNTEESLPSVRNIINKLTFGGSKMFEYIMSDNDSKLDIVLKQFNDDYTNLSSLLSNEEESIVSYNKSDVVYSMQHYKDILDKLRAEKNEKAEIEKNISDLTDDKARQNIILDEFRNKSKNADELVTVSYKEEILDLDISLLKVRFNDNYRSLLRSFNSQYRKDCELLRSYSRTNERSKYKMIVELLEKISDAQQKRSELEDQDKIVRKISEQLDELQNKLKELNDTIQDLNNEYPLSKQKYKGSYDLFVTKTQQLISHYEDHLKQVSDNISISFAALSETLNDTITENSDIKDIANKLEWIDAFLSAAKAHNASESFMKMTAAAVPEHLRSVEKMLEKVSVWNHEFNDMTAFFMSQFDEERQKTFTELPVEKLAQAVADCRDNFNKLENLIDHNNAVQVMEKHGLSQFIDIIEDMELDSSEILPCYEKCFYRSWLDNVIPRFDQINMFRHDRQEEKIKEFKELDITHLKISQVILKGQLIERLPNLNFSGAGDEAAILKRELNKRSRLMPIRKLIAAIPSLLPALKPCMMMSPLSVSTYFGNADFGFDTVIFDEASQVRTEEAVCSIFRAKQVIIAGDSKQLPPTDFFSSSASGPDELYDDDEGINDAGAYESLLDEAAILPSQTLLWHYRSKHEHLIAFSNYKIYQKSLITFPSAIKKAPDLGVEYIYLSDGVYERGGKGGNLKEAEKICSLLVEHFTDHPKRSIGIIAFGAKQQTIIENEVLKLRREHPEFEEYFRDNRDEPLFIRNLESVQGDERDTIIFSIGYGKDQNGKFLMNFGPLSREGGERRLNVAVTRARYNLKLVGSILPSDIKTDRISAVGPSLLRDYIDFAMHGESVLKSELQVEENVWFDSPFEESVYNFLTSQGFKVATQVGCSGYRIDLAVYHPNYEGRFAIGIECDGAAYHSARTARERDRLRQTVLENMGWKIYRIWSTDWIKDAVSEKKRLIDAINISIMNYSEPTMNNTPEKDIKTEYIDITEKTETEIQIEQKKNYRSAYAGCKPQEIPSYEYEVTLLKILEDGYGSRQIDNLIRDAANLGYDWHRVGRIIREKFITAIYTLVRKQKVEVNGDEVKLLQDPKSEK